MTITSDFISWSHWSKQTRLIEDAVWARQAEFEEKFCHGEELLSVWLSSETVKVVYLLYEGQHVTDSFPLTDLIDFFAS